MLDSVLEFFGLVTLSRYLKYLNMWAEHNEGLLCRLADAKVMLREQAFLMPESSRKNLLLKKIDEL